jgi:hypothetical protein
MGGPTIVPVAATHAGGIGQVRVDVVGVGGVGGKHKINQQDHRAEGMLGRHGPLPHVRGWRRSSERQGNATKSHSTLNQQSCPDPWREATPVPGSSTQVP